MILLLIIKSKYLQTDAKQNPSARLGLVALVPRDPKVTAT